MVDKFIDFSSCSLDLMSSYDGSDRKDGIIYNNKRYMIKYAERNAKKNDMASTYVNNVLSEYIGSHIVASLGIPAQNTLLGERNNHLVVACENFLRIGEHLHDFGWYLRRHFDSSEIGKIPKYHMLYEVFNIDQILQPISDVAIERYWDTFVADALIGNFDRHKGNWGYIADERDSSVSCSPVYDCGSCLYPKLAEEVMLETISNEKELLKRIYDFPNAALIVNGKNKVSYYDMLASGYDEHCTSSLLKIAPLIDMDKIETIIDETPLLSETRKLFYKFMLRARKDLIIDRAYNLAIHNSRDENAYQRVLEGYQKDEKTTASSREAKILGESGWSCLKYFSQDELLFMKANGFNLDCSEFNARIQNAQVRAAESALVSRARNKNLSLDR